MKIKLKFKKVTWLPRTDGGYQIKGVKGNYCILFDKDENVWYCYCPEIGVKKIEGLEKAKAFVVSQLRNDIKGVFEFYNKFISDELSI